MRRHAAGLLGLVMVLVLTGSVWAQPDNAVQREAEMKAAIAAAQGAAKTGPAEIPLLDEAVLHLPEKMAFVPSAEAIRLMHAAGNQAGPGLVGLVTSAESWTVLITWTAAGYVKDDEAATLDAGEILKGLQEGTADANTDRRSRGFPELEVGAWTQVPRYDKATHHLTWALPVIETVSREVTTNLNTRSLGRDGYFSVNLIDSPEAIEGDRPALATLLSGLQYVPGKTYEDFNASTDHVAEFGLAALIGVVAAKKLGLLALAAAFLLKFAKVGFLMVAGAGLALRRFFKRTPKA